MFFFCLLLLLLLPNTLSQTHVVASHGSLLLTHSRVGFSRSLPLSLYLFAHFCTQERNQNSSVGRRDEAHTHTTIEVALRKRERDADREPAVILPPLRATICLQQLCIHTLKNWPPPLFSKHIQQTYTHTERHLCTQKHQPVPRECLGHAGALQHAAIPLLGRRSWKFLGKFGEKRQRCQRVTVGKILYRNRILGRVFSARWHFSRLFWCVKISIVESIRLLSRHCGRICFTCCIYRRRVCLH